MNKAAEQRDELRETPLRLALALIDQANAADPVMVTLTEAQKQTLQALPAPQIKIPAQVEPPASGALPKEIWHSLLATKFLFEMEPNPTGAQQIATRAHHVRRWEIPRNSFPRNRAGYLRWRTKLGKHHATVTQEIMQKAGFDTETISQVSRIITKTNLKSDPQVQLHEDVLCLVFLTTQLDSLDMTTEKLQSVLGKTLKKMSVAGRQVATNLELDEKKAQLLGDAISANLS